MARIIDESEFNYREPNVDLEMFQKGMRRLPAVLRDLGYSGLRPGQDQIIYSVMGGVDTIAVASTAFGKTACMIIPALCFDFRLLIFCPLKSLMRDQVKNLQRQGIVALNISSDNQETENARNISDWVRGDCKILYIAPERLMNPMFMAAMRQAPPQMLDENQMHDDEYDGEPHCFPGRQYIPTETGMRSMLDLWDAYRNGQALPKTLSRMPTGELVWRQITKVWKIGKKPLVKVKIEGAGEVQCTADQIWFSEHGEIPASSLKAGDRVHTTNLSRGKAVRGLNSDQLQILVGSYLGDGGIGTVSERKNSVRFSLTHGIAQEVYCRLKMAAFGGDLTRIEENGYAGKPAVRGRTPVFQLPGELKPSRRWNLKPPIPMWMLSAFDVRALAIWVMDDGSACWSSTKKLNGFVISANDFSEVAVGNLKDLLSGRFGLEAVVFNSKGFSLRLNADSARRLCNLVRPYLSPDLAYKFGFTAEEVAKTQYQWNPNYSSYLEEVVSVTKVNEPEEDVFDIEVEESHNFFALTRTSCKAGVGYVTETGVLVHNCHSRSSDDSQTACQSIGEITEPSGIFKFPDCSSVSLQPLGSVDGDADSTRLAPPDCAMPVLRPLVENCQTGGEPPDNNTLPPTNTPTNQ